MMNTFIRKIFALAGATTIAVGALAQNVSTDNVDVRVVGNQLNVSANLVLDSLFLRSNNQIFITPVVKCDTMTADMPSLLVSGRNMHISYQRGVLKNFEDIKSHNILKEMERKNGTKQSFSYATRVPLTDWMDPRNLRVTFVYDSCGCGTLYGQKIGEDIIVFHNPVKEMTARMMPAPKIEALPEVIHEGKARIQFEVDRTQLHVDPYRCKNGQLIDNREQIAAIDDSVKYALTDPNVEITQIDICGYASPESPYLHNVELASGRSKALAEYLADRYNLPRGSVKYSYVPENWEEFREEVLTNKEISEEERQMLLELIDAPATTPQEYDAKERTLKTDPRFSKLYRTKILPQWFPRLRATTFAIHTRLKPLDDRALAEVIKTTPEKMSLNQMFRVASLYPVGSDDYNKVIDIMLDKYPDNEITVVNAATAAVMNQDYAKAKEILQQVAPTPEIYNLKGIIATAEGIYEEAENYFKQAGDLPDAERNLMLLK